MILKFGSKGDAVAILQKRLNTHGHKLFVDGDFGQLTENAVIAFQKSKGLVADGIVGDKTNAALTGSDTSKFLTDADYIAAAKRLDVPELVIRAFAETESSTGGFLTDGRPIILFERHHMYQYLSELTSKANADKKRVQYPNVVNTATGGYRGGSAEYTRLALAKQFNEQAALQSCSWGQFQIMGWHWKSLGYESVNDFVAQMYISESQQLEAFLRYIEWKKGTVDKKQISLLDALKAQNWHAVFSLYNGPNYKKLGYDSKFTRIMNRLTPIYGNKAA
ncbi:N-acetylmuramidase domain-containing protein [Acinetobacter populi]|nr:N-acetylmuramidase family protein [Acinetobacter populi]